MTNFFFVSFSGKTYNLFTLNFEFLRFDLKFCITSVPFYC